MMAFAAESANETYKQDNTPERVAERAKQETQKKEKERQDTIDKYAPVYCNNQQNISINEPALASEGWPTPNGNGISDDECKTLIAKLYDYLNGYTRIGSRIEDIANRKMWVGMEKIELVYSQGSPRDTNRTTTANGTREQWVYGSPLYGTGGYAYIENDVVTSIQN